MCMGLKTVLRGIGAVLLVLCISMPVCAQNSKKVKNLKAQKTQLQKNLKKNQQALVKTGKDVKDGQSYLHHIDRQLEDRVEHIRIMEHEMDSIETEMKHVRANIVSLDAQLADKKQKYLRAIRFPRSETLWSLCSVPKALRRCTAVPDTRASMPCTSTTWADRYSRSRAN